MKKTDVIPAWGRILRGYRPLLSIEITKECPLSCPGCYAYGAHHLGSQSSLLQLVDQKGSELVDGILAVVRRYRPLHISIVGGEPLVRWRELDTLLPRLDAMKVEVQLVTSAVRPIPVHWAAIRSLHIAVSVDGLPEEHDRRRKPATYERILKHIHGQSVIVHCTITAPMLRRDTYLHDFADFWSGRPEARKIWFSLFTPQQDESCEERLTTADRHRTVQQLSAVAARFPKVDMPRAVLDGYLRPPAAPDACIFAQSTVCVSADLTTRITPCQFGGRPVCAECGCMASSGLASIGRYQIGGLVPVSAVFSASRKIGGLVAALA